MKIYISVDMEGISGIYKFEQTRDPAGPLFREGLEYMMGDIAAAVKGLRKAGADEILVWDSHSRGDNFIPHLMEPEAKYITGASLPRPMWGLDKTFDGLVLLGYHAMCGTPDGVLHHTQSSKAEMRYWYNGVESGELAQHAAIAGHFGVPPILVTGDQATCREARRFFGKACVTVPVKEGIHREAAVLYPMETTRGSIFEGAQQAVAALPRCKPYKLRMPIEKKVQKLLFESSQTRLVTEKSRVEDIFQIL